MRTALLALLAALTPALALADVAPSVDASSPPPAAAPAPPPSGAPTPEVLAAAKGGNAFALELFGKLRSEKPGNLFFSPLSVAAALSLVDVGASGKTATELDQVLRSGLPHDAAHHALADLVKREVSGRGDVTLSVANRLWARAGLAILPSYLAALGSEFDAGLEQVDFSKSAAASKLINDWVKAQTAGKITQLVSRDALDARTDLVLTNAVYFLGTWKNPFDPAKTADAPFTLASGEKPDVPMMHQVAKVQAAESDGVQVVELPYGHRGTLVYDLLLPTATQGLPALEKRLDAATLDALLGGLRPSKVTLSLPRFTERSQFELSRPLAAMGLGSLFKDPDLSAMTSSHGIAISSVVHQAFVDVNEKGTEAAAATAVIGSRAMHRTQELTVNADHPFLFLIRDASTGGILFLGRLDDPRK